MARLLSVPEARAQLALDVRPLVVDDRVPGAVAVLAAADEHVLAVDALERAPIASIAPRERSFCASVFSSTRRQPQTSNACRSISSFASTLTPVPQADGWSHVQPISTEPCSGRSARNRVEPTTRSPATVDKRDLRPGRAASERGVDVRVELLARRRLHDREPRATSSGRATPAQSPSAWCALERLEPHARAFERRCRPAAPSRG